MIRIRCTRRQAFLAALFTLVLFTPFVRAQGTRADYERANTVRQRTANQVFRARVEPHWVEGGDRFWYRNDLPGGKKEFVLVDAAKGTRTVVTEDQLPKGAKPAAGETGPAEEFVALRQPPPARRGTDSPDGTWEAFLKDDNVWLRDRKTKEETQLSIDGEPGDEYGRVVWAPDSKKLIAIRTRAGGDRRVTLVESAPRDQLQPKMVTYEYLKPGDPIPRPKPHLFDIETKKEVPVSDALFPNPWEVSHEHWTPDSKRFLFVYNQRGHQVVRVVAIDAATGKTTAVVNEECQTFFDYTNKLFVHYLDATGELLWMSERSGWNHLYRVDVATGAVKTPVTKGGWVVRGVDRVDETAGEVWVRAVGVHPGQDPYHVHFARVKLDGTGLTLLTAGDGTHSVQYSPDRRYLVDTFSRADLPPVTELRRAADGKKVCALETADVAGLKKVGWPTPERFVARGRDGTTDIHGLIFRPSTFDPRQKYRVIEHIYAGPHDHHVWKRFSPAPYEQPMAELGFVVVKIDGMGTNWRSKAFHDVCWKNLGDGGFPDRIAWLKAAAAEHSEMDIAKGVGIFGGSAGGQSTVRGMTEYPDFYTVGVADCGCHDNRMDKIWWNEQWMGWPVGPHYAAQSNVTNAHKLKGRLLLVVGEVDRNVDPASTMQVANALVKADKDFDLLIVPGAGHGAAERPYGNRRRMDFFVRHLLGVEPRAE
ncbi:MAG: peptidase [Gemmataceae bacterium]|nr:peptidase [Gemmataceae bacterium]